MDVSRISMITPKVIDWRKLTAKDIIKYDSEGMNVPSEYLSWAKSFRVDLEKNDTDETTYEMAVSKPLVSQKIPKPADTTARRDTSTKTENDKMQTAIKENTGATAPLDTQNTEETQDNQTTEETDEQTNTTQTTEDDENLTASEKMQKLTDNGEGFVSIAKTFQGDSEKKTDDSNTISNTVTSLGEASDNSIASLDSYMSDLLAKADDIQSKINTEKNKQNKNATNISKILQLQNELKELGTSGQTVALGYDTDLSSYQPTIDSGTTIGLDAQDYGGVTEDLGKDLKRFIWHAAIGRQVEDAGKKAQSTGSSTVDNSTIVSDRNNSNLHTVQQQQSEIYNKTGVSAEEVRPDENNNTQNNANNTQRDVFAKSNPETTTEKTVNKESSPLEKRETLTQKLAKENDNSSDDKKTDVEKKEEKIASGSLDEILKRKLRKGEVQEQA